MSDSVEKIKFDLDIQRVLEILASQIYPSPFALLRENTQNAFDAILLRIHRGEQFEPRIDVRIDPQIISIQDNGIGMTRADLTQHYWKAGSSSKNTPEARAAGVVGTFGIGAMANFGIAEELHVTTESAVVKERTLSIAKRSTLSITDDCIEVKALEAVGKPGTHIEARILPEKAVQVQQAESYLAQFVRHLPSGVFINGKLASQQPLEASVPPIQANWTQTFDNCDLGGGIRANVTMQLSITGDVRLALVGIHMGGQALDGALILRQGVGSMQTLRSGFGLATVSVSSVYGLGGIADLVGLQPTAGREALNTQSMQLLQELVTRMDDFVSAQIAARPESNNNVSFMNWVIQRGRYDLCGQLRVTFEPRQEMRLEELKSGGAKHAVLVYGGTDPAIMKLASSERPILLLSRGNPRRQCEHEYLRHFCKIEEISDDPKVLKAKDQTTWSLGESALSFRLTNTLAEDYFVTGSIYFGALSHGLPLIVTKRTEPIEIHLDPDSQSVKFLVSIYEREYGHFSSLVKDFCRSVVFPKISDLVPSSTRQGAEAFLKAIQRPREVFEYEMSDLDSLPGIWRDYLEGRLSMQDAADRSAQIVQRSVQVLESNAAAAVREVVPGVIEGEQAFRPAQDEDSEASTAAPPIQRLDIGTEKKLLTIDPSEPDLRGYRCFLAISDRIREEKGEFFLQPHRTSIVWGGQKAMFIFEHHSGEFGLYYDIQAPEPIGEKSGGGRAETCTIVMKNRIFIPVPSEIAKTFLPKPGEKKRLEVRCDLLYVK